MLPSAGRTGYLFLMGQMGGTQNHGRNRCVVKRVLIICRKNKAALFTEFRNRARVEVNCAYQA